MNVDKAVLAFAGCVVLLGLALGTYVNAYWYLLTAFAGLNTLQAAQSNFEQLGNASQSAGGALQAMQAGNQINMAVGQELMKLNAQTAVFQQALLEEQAREMAGDQVVNKKLQNAYSGGKAYQRSNATPAPTLGGN